jgi:hypothetical protein
MATIRRATAGSAAGYSLDETAAGSTNNRTYMNIGMDTT